MGCLKWTAIITIIVLPLSAVVLQWANSVDIKSYYKDKRIIITGASQGIGKDLAIRLAQLGSRLVIAARTESKLKETQQLCKQYSQDVFTVKADVSVEEDTKLIVNEAVKHLGGIDILILNAAKTPSPIMFTEFEDPGETFLSFYRVNVLQAVYLTQYSLPHLRKSHGSILAVSSMAGIFSCEKNAPYIASKAALHGYFGSLQREFELRKENISITIMPLGLIYTKHSLNLLKANYNSIMEPGITPQECAEKMIRGLPLKTLYYYTTWGDHLFAHLHSLSPYWFNYLTSLYVHSMFEGFE